MILIRLSPQEAELLWAVLATARPTEALGDSAPSAVRNAAVMAHASAVRQIQDAMANAAEVSISD